MVSNKFYVGKECARCDNEGIVSECCLSEIKFISNGRPKCIQCRRLCRIDFCPDCKEDYSCMVIDENNDQEYTQRQGKKQKYQALYYIILIVFILLNITIYVALKIK